MQINNKIDKQSFKSLTPLNKPLGVFYNPNAVLPTLVIEGGVTLGRSIEANKRGGIEEASDRFVEQGTSAVVWLWGVQALQKAGEAIGKKLLKLDNLDFNLGRDILRNPVKNNNINAKTAAFKAGNLLGATAIATYFIGFVLPKISSFISKKIAKNHESDLNSSKDKNSSINNFTPAPKELSKANKSGLNELSKAKSSIADKKPIESKNLTESKELSEANKSGLNGLSERKEAIELTQSKELTKNIPPTIEEFKNSTKKDKNIAFTSLYNNVLNLANVIETNSTARMLLTDSGVIAGRCKNAKTKFKKIENLFRDVSSIYFYLFSVKHTVALLNKLTKTTDIDPKILSKTTDLLKDFKGSKEDFLKTALGTAAAENIKELDKLFESKEIISFEEFSAKFPQYKDKAKKMSQLQPVFNDRRVLTRMQARDVLSSGKVSDPEFLKDAFSHATKGASDNKLKFVSKKSLENMRLSIDKFVKQVYNASSGEVDKELIEKVANKNSIKSFGFYSLATAISMFALGILIPKIQYAITRKLTHSSNRPE